MSSNESISREEWTKGRRGCAACLTVTEWPDLAHVVGEADHLTHGMVERWAAKNYPGQTVRPASFGDGYVGVRIMKTPPAPDAAAQERSERCMTV